MKKKVVFSLLGLGLLGTGPTPGHAQEQPPVEAPSSQQDLLLKMVAPTSQQVDELAQPFQYEGTYLLAGSAPTIAPLYDKEKSLSLHIADPNGIKEVILKHYQGDRLISQERTIFENAQKIEGVWDFRQSEISGQVIELKRQVPLVDSPELSHYVLEVETLAGQKEAQVFSYVVDQKGPSLSLETGFEKGAILDAGRLLTVVLETSQFDQENFSLNLSRNGESLDANINWQELEKGRYQAEILVHEEGDYQFSATYRDRFGRESSLEPMTFTIDTVKPSLLTETQPGLYGSEQRVIFRLSDKHLDLANSQVWLIDSTGHRQALSWQKGEDVYEASVYLKEDGSYRFEALVQDLAGNQTNLFNGQLNSLELVIDKNGPLISLSGLDRGQDIFTEPVLGKLEVEDAHLKTIEAYLIRQDINGQEVRHQLQGARQGKVWRGSFEVGHDLTEDGYYTLRVEAQDEAGHQNILEKQFYLGRKGATLTWQGPSEKILQQISKDLTFSVVSPLPLDQVSIIVTKNHALLPDNQVQSYLTVNQEEGPWAKWQLGLAPELFAEDGFYTVELRTEDRAKRQAYTGLEQPIQFLVDQSQPELASLTGLESLVNEGAWQTFAYQLTDFSGIQEVAIYVNDDLLVRDFYDAESLVEGTQRFLSSGQDTKITFLIRDQVGNIKEEHIHLPGKEASAPSKEAVNQTQPPLVHPSPPVGASTEPQSSFDIRDSWWLLLPIGGIGLVFIIRKYLAK